MEIILVLIMWWPGMGGKEIEYPMPSWKVCQQAVAAGQLRWSTGGEGEGGAALFCAYRKREGA